MFSGNHFDKTRASVYSLSDTLSKKTVGCKHVCIIGKTAYSSVRCHKEKIINIIDVPYIINIKIFVACPNIDKVKLLSRGYICMLAGMG